MVYCVFECHYGEAILRGVFTSRQDAIDNAILLSERDSEKVEVRTYPLNMMLEKLPTSSFTVGEWDDDE